MKKWVLFLFILALAGCSQTDNSTPLFTEEQAVDFEVITHEEKISPVFSQMTPYIIMASDQAQLERLLSQFDVEADIDMTKHNAAMLVTYSDSCGIEVNGVYNKDNKLSVQLAVPEGDTACKEIGIPHTLIIAVEKDDYDMVELYHGDIIKASLNMKK